MLRIGVIPPLDTVTVADRTAPIMNPVMDEMLIGFDPTAPGSDYTVVAVAVDPPPPLTLARLQEIQRQLDDALFPGLQPYQRDIVKRVRAGSRIEMVSYDEAYYICLTAFAPRTPSLETCSLCHAKNLSEYHRSTKENNRVLCNGCFQIESEAGRVKEQGQPSLKAQAKAHLKKPHPLDVAQGLVPVEGE